MYGRADGTCGGCNLAKKFFDKHEVEYEFKDIGTADVVKRVQYKKELMAHKVDKIPFIMIGENKIIGFDEHVLSTILDLPIDK